MPAARRPKLEMLNNGKGWWWRFIGANGKTECHAEIFQGGKGACKKAVLRFGDLTGVRVVVSDNGEAGPWVEIQPAATIPTIAQSAAKKAPAKLKK